MLKLKGNCFFCHGDSQNYWCLDCAADLSGQETERCPVCATHCKDERICAHCLLSTPAFDSAVVAFDYCYPVDRLIHRIKYGHKPELLFDLAALLIHKLAERSSSMPTAIIPVPLHGSKQRQRGFNQSLLIARQLSRQLNIELLPKAIKRVRKTISQTGLDKKQRQQNVKNAFRLEREIPDHQHIAIVDDVVTTGATVGEIARILRKAGYTEIEVWALARTPT